MPTRFVFLVAGLLGLTVTGPLWGQQRRWVLIYEDYPLAVYADQRSIVRVGTGVRQVWTKWEYDQIQRGEYIGEYDKLTSLDQFDCPNRRSRSMRSVIHKGDLMVSSSDTPERWSSPFPETVGEGVLLGLCEYLGLIRQGTAHGRPWEPILDLPQGNRLRFDSDIAPRPPLPSPLVRPPPDFVQVERQPVPIEPRIEPEYPELARLAGIEGRVTLRLWVGKNGWVHEVQILRSDNELFNEPAVAAVRQWRFQPALQAGNPVDVWLTLPIRFRQRRDVPTEWSEATRSMWAGVQIGTPRLDLHQLFGRPGAGEWGSVSTWRYGAGTVVQVYFRLDGTVQRIVIPPGE